MELSEQATARARSIYRVTIIGSIGNLILVIFKFIAGIVGRSDAMIADAVHSLSDLATDIIVIFFVHISAKPQDKDHDFGHGKYETLATAVIGLILFAVGLGVLWKGAAEVWQWYNGVEIESPGLLALIAALVSIAVKEIIYRYTVRRGRQLDSQAVIANAWHHRSDALSSIGTTIGIGGAILLGSKWSVLDPLAAIVVSIFIMRTAYRLIKPCIEELTEKSLPDDIEKEIQDVLIEVMTDCHPHNMRTRRIGNKKAVDVHVHMDGDLTVRQSHEVTKIMEERIRALLGPDTFIYIHVEPSKRQITT